MTLRNKLFLVLFDIKENDKWQNWKNFAEKNDFFYSTLYDPNERPILRGKLNKNPISIEAVTGSKPKLEMHLKIKSQIHNPDDFYFSIQDKNAYSAKSEIFNKSLHGFCENKLVEEKFFIKSNSERFAMRVLNNQDFSNELLSQNNFSIEIVDYELILTKFDSIEINREFISLLKLFANVLKIFEQISIDAIVNRKQGGKNGHANTSNFNHST